ncbi:MAG: GAF domain-containing protein [Planctomycetes bacterium]|nr:GAF domain-containing protein [Planctomycetota bacterium]
MAGPKATRAEGGTKTGALRVTGEHAPTSAGEPPAGPSAVEVHRRLILLYVQASAVAVVITLFLVFCGLEFSGRQWGLLLAGVSIGVPAYVIPDILVIRRQFRPLRQVLEELDRGGRPDEETHARGMICALNLPLTTFARISLLHGPLAATVVLVVLVIANQAFAADFAVWQFVFLTSAILFFASPAHATYEYFALSRRMVPVVDRLWQARREVPDDWQSRVRSLRLKSKLFYLSVFLSALPLAFLASSLVFKADLLLSRHGLDAGLGELMPVLGWAAGLVAVTITLVMVIAYQLAADATQGAADLAEAMKRVQEGRLDVELRVSGTDEYADLYRGFNHMTEELRDELRIHAITHELAGVLDLDLLIARIMNAARDLLGAERSSLFLHDAERDELWSRYAEGLSTREIRFPADLGIAGHVFRSGESANIDDVYADRRFNPDVDRATGYLTRNILCIPIVHKRGTRIGVAQVLNKESGGFSATDEARFRSFAAQISASLENARLFESVLEMKNYSDAILRSTSDGIVTLDRDRRIVTANAAACRILATSEREAIGRLAADFFGGANAWVLTSVDRVARLRDPDLVMDADYQRGAQSSSVNLRASELLDGNDDAIGFLLAFEDLTGEKKLKTTMARYMSKEVADQVLEAGADALTGRSQKVSVLFSDIRGFTSISEELGARETVAMLNEYFEVMVEIVHRRGGILDKYIGDAIMALFGAPIENPEDADRALRCANEMMSALGRLNQLREARGQVPIEIGVGICTGEVVAGNIGSSKRLDYTAIGDHVNIASRLEGATKAYGVGILVSEFTVQALGEDHLLREIDVIRVKGKNRPVRVFEALDHLVAAGQGEALAAFLARYETALDCGRDRRWAEALIAFELALELRPDDRPALIHLERCRRYLENPPPEDWDGVWIMESK